MIQLYDFYKDEGFLKILLLLRINNPRIEEKIKIENYILAKYQKQKNFLLDQLFI